MKDKEPLFPKIKRSINSFVEDEEGNVPIGKIISIGTLLIILGSILSINVFAKHGSHSSHSSHASHASTSYHKNHSNSHSSHVSSHTSHASHSSHTSHSNTASHSNSNYSAGGDYGTPTAPSASNITSTGISKPSNIDVTGSTSGNHGATIPNVYFNKQEVGAISGDDIFIIENQLNVPQDTPGTIVPSVAINSTNNNPQTNESPEYSKEIGEPPKIE